MLKRAVYRRSRLKLAELKVEKLVPRRFTRNRHQRFQEFRQIYLVKDQGIFSAFKKFGSWEILEVSLSVQIISRSNVNLIFDLGANQGLWSMQTLQLLLEQNYELPQLVTVEPDKLLSSLILLNLLSIGPNPHLIHNHHSVALVNSENRELSTDTYFTSNFFTDSRSVGHQTTEAALVPKQWRIEKTVTAINAQTFFSSLVREFHNKRIFIKSDLQGSDADVLCAANSEFWRLVSGFQIEIWPIGRSSLEIRKLLHLLDSKYHFFLASENAFSKVDEDELSNYWMSNTLLGSTFGSYKTLFGFKKDLDSGFFLNAAKSHNLTF